MRKTILASLLFACVACCFARAEASQWFSENAASFHTNANHRWHYIPGTATYENGLINSHHLDGLEGHDLEVKYNPVDSAVTAVVSNEVDICFNDLGDETKDSLGSLVAVQVVIGFHGNHVFAVLNPTEGSASWLITEVPAETNILYHLSIIVTYTTNGGFIRYYGQAPGGTPFEIANVQFPKGAAKTTEYAMAGECSVAEIAAWLSGESTDAYHRWYPLNGVYTWRGGTSIVHGDYDVFDSFHGVDLGCSVATGRVFSSEVAGLFTPPGSGIRFTNAVDVVSGTDILHFGGMLVEPGADGLKLSAKEMRFGDPTAVSATYFRILDNVTLGSAGSAIVFFGDITIEIAAGKTLDLSAADSVALDQNSFAHLHFVGGGTIKLPASGLMAAGPVALDYSETLSGFRLDGRLTVDGSTSFSLPSGTPEGGTGYKLAEDTVTGGESSTRRSLAVGDTSFIAQTTIADSKLSYIRESYGDWLAYPGVFTWMGGTAFETGTFRVFNAANGCDTDALFYGGEAAADVPGWGDGVFRDFISVFCNRACEGQVLCRDSGYVLRFADSAGSDGVVRICSGTATFGGLLVEPGAVGYSITCDEFTKAMLRFGPVASLTSTNRIEIHEDFAITCATNVELVGRSHIKIGTGKTLSVALLTTGTDRDPCCSRPYLSFAGGGVLDCDKVIVTGASTLDFSELERSPTDAPFIQGDVYVADLTRLVLPASLTEGTAYRVCGGTLTMTSGIRPVALGDGEFEYKTVTVDSANGTVSWSAATVNQLTLSSASVNWADISGGLTAGQPIVLNLACDSRLTINASGVSFPSLLVTGPYRLQILLLFNPVFGKVFVGRGTSCEFVIAPGVMYGGRPRDCESWNDPNGFSVDGACAYDIVIEGQSGRQSSWDNVITVYGSLILRNQVELTSARNTVGALGTLRVDTGSSVKLNGAINGIGGYVEVVKDASLTMYENSGQGVTADRIFVYDGSDFTLVVKGDLDLGGTSQTLATGGTVELHGGGCISCNADNDSSITLVSPACLRACKGTDDSPAELSASVVYNADGFVIVEDGETLLMDGETDLNGGGVLDPCGSGMIEIPEDVILPFTNDFFCTGGIVGEGTACFYADPSRSLAGPSLMSPDWKGRCLIQNAPLAEFDPARCGNPLSTIVFDGAHGYFAKNVASTAPFVMWQQTNATDPSLDVTSGYDESGESVPNVLGEGVLQISTDGSGNGGHRFFIADPTTYDGSYCIGSGVMGGIVLGTSEYLNRMEEFGSAINGQIAVVTGVVEIAENAWWSAKSGINVYSHAAVTDTGMILTPVVGSGAVRYYGNLVDEKPESAADFEDKTLPGWCGTVEIRNCELNGRTLTSAGNDNSSILFDGVIGSLAPQNNNACLVVDGSGLEITNASNGRVWFRRLAGTALLRIETHDSASSAGSSFQFADVENFTGKFLLDSASTYVIFGDDEGVEPNATLAFADGVRIRSNQDWTAPYVSFKPNLTVIGAAVGDSIVRAVSNEYVYLDHVSVVIEDGIGVDSRIRHGLEFDRDDREVFLTMAETPPSMEVGDVSVRYGVDFTNAMVTLTVTNYWEGYKFRGRTEASVKIYDAYGQLVGAADCEVTTNGIFVIGVTDLPFGSGSDYHYTVMIETVQDTTSETTELGRDSINVAGVRNAGGWFSEDADSFAAAGVSPKKTGDWIYETGAAETNDEKNIVFNTPEIGATAVVAFEPYRGISNEYARVHYGDVTFDTMCDWEGSDQSVVDIGGGFAAVTLACDFDAETPQPYFAVWVCNDHASTSGRFERVSSSLVPEVGRQYSIDCTINRKRQTIGYVIDGLSLTNCEGLAFFPLPDAAANVDDYTLLFKGRGRVSSLAGDQSNANLASVVTDCTTNEYATVEAAVAAATNANDRVALLWDASWRPNTEDVGRTIRFANGDYHLHIDQSTTNSFAGGGYRFIDNDDGSYTIGVIEYELQFQPNDANGSMPSQKFSVTNMIFTLISNAFVRTGFDFDRWNEKENGRGVNSWSDGGVIDMSEFGLADKKLYAQWKVAMKTIVIEPADEYVYVERITTNGQDVAGVRYIAHSDPAERAKGRGSAVIPVLYGSTCVVRFSTDVDKTMTTPDWKIDPGYRQYYSVSNSFRVANLGTNLPHYTNDVDKAAAGELPAPLDELEVWAIVHGIPQEAIAAAPLYATASMKLGMSTLLTKEQEIIISEFKTYDDCYKFKVTIGDQPLENPDKILPMIQVSGDLADDWHQVDAKMVSVDADGTVTVLTNADASFVKIVIPSN